MAEAATQQNTGSMHRPHLSAAQEKLALQYRPTQDCPHCKATPTQWLMEVPQRDQPLEYYCANCGRYVLVTMGALGV
jgi:hypothetical protein